VENLREERFFLGDLRGIGADSLARIDELLERTKEEEK
jgi:hypothetical protein